MIENPNVICNDCAYCKQNKELKELLKECRILLSFLQINDYDNNGLLVIGRINQALGEDE